MSSNPVERERGSIDYDLSSADEEVRRLAVERLSALPDAEALDRLVECLGDGSWRVRKAAVTRISSVQDSAAAVSVLIGALADGDNSGRRNSAVEGLVRYGRTGLPQLIEALASDDEDVRKQVVDVIAGIGDESAAPSMLRVLEDSDPNVSAAAADALGVLGGEGAASALEALALRDTAEALVRVSALRALAQLDVSVDVTQFEALLHDSILRPAVFAVIACSDSAQADEWLRKGLVLQGRTPRNAAVEGLVSMLSRRDGDDAVHLCERIREAIDANPEVVSAIVEDLDAGDLSTRMTQIQFLGLVRAPGAAVAILEAGRDEAISELALRTLAGLGDSAEEAIDAAWDGLDVLLRREACRVLGSTAGELGAARLQRALDDPDSSLRAAAVVALGNCGCVEAVPALVRRLEVSVDDDDDEIFEERAAVTQALVEIAQAETTTNDSISQMIDALSARLDGAAESVRFAVARVLGQIGRPEDERQVSLLLRDPSAEVRRAAVEALARLSQGETCEPLRLALADESAGVRCAAAAALGESHNEAVIEDLERLGLDEDVRVRSASVCALGRHGAAVEASRARALNRIEASLADEVPVVIAAAEALAELGGAASARVATRLLDHEAPEVVLAAVDCIREHGNDEALDHLLPLTAHGDWSVRAEVMQALGERRFVRSIPAILRRLETEQDGFVRDTILNALRRLEA